MNENQVGVILEEVRDMFKTLAEGQTIIENRMDSLEAKVDKLEIKVDKLETKVDSEMGRLNKKLEIVIEQTATLSEKVAEHEVRLKIVEKKVV